MNKNPYKDRQYVVDVDRKYSWHPFTQMKDYENVDPVVITHAKGIKLYDADGNEYYDTISSWWTSVIGHCDERINAAIIKQLSLIEHVNFSGFTHPYAAEVFENMRSILPDIYTRFFFSDDGSTAIEVALKMAFQYWQNIGKKDKTKFVMFNNAYHGDTMGATSVGGVDIYHKIYKPMMFDSYIVPAPYEHPRKSEFTYDARNEDFDPASLEQMRKVMEEHADEIAAVIVEPLIQGASGMRIYHPQYLTELKKLAEKNDILVICDEVATGFGRTGTMFAFEQAADFTPDIVAVAKGLTGGYMPMAITLTNEKIFMAFYGDFMSTFFHGHSYTANPLACAAANATIKILKEENLPKSNSVAMEYFHERLRELKEYDFVGDIRFLGFYGAIDIVKSRAEKELFSAETRIGLKIYRNSLKNGLVLRAIGEVIYWCLPLNVTIEEIDIIIDRSIKVIKETICQVSTKN
ncbi:MAG: adenosylmethionine--8-amino-7-oxononanoate transaminase [Verrucomicrobiota bacterium]|nr:adenosylmethionine--8-amino-7-oxononanoate transaminase [Verrucomicrobiota bacterium]